VTSEQRARAEAKDGPLRLPPLTKKDLAEAEKKGLLDEANLEIFMTWWSFGGPQQGISPMQAAQMPAAMRQDFAYILEEVRRERRRQETLGKKIKP
jgi:hypothetical protein